MSSSVKVKSIDSAQNPPEGHLSGWSFYSDTSQNVIETTEDKLRLYLIEHRRAVASRQKWAAPATLLFTLITALVTTDFKEEAIGIAGSTWKSFFMLASVATVFWLVRSLWSIYHQYQKGEIDFVIDELKNVGNEGAL